jgi:hypothetical protein
MPLPTNHQEDVIECLKNAKDVFNAVGPFLLGKDQTGILIHGVATASNWIDKVLKEESAKGEK